VQASTVAEEVIGDTEQLGEGKQAKLMALEARHDQRWPRIPT
jgi:hypothetical protein